MVQLISDPLQTLKSALVIIVENSTKATPQEILSATESIDDVLTAHAAKLEPQLLHFLQRRSYGKALAHLRQA